MCFLTPDTWFLNTLSWLYAIYLITVWILRLHSRASVSFWRVSMNFWACFSSDLLGGNRPVQSQRSCQPLVTLYLWTQSEQTVLLQPRKILGLTTHWLQGREPYSYRGMLCHSPESCKSGEPSHRIWQPVSVRQPQPICKHNAKSWLIDVMAIANLMNKHKLQFNSHLGSSDSGSILSESHWQFAVQAPMSLRCALSAVCIPLLPVPGSFAQGTSTLPANWLPPAWKNEHVDGIV